MQKLKIVLQSNFIYYIIILLTLLIVWYSTCFVKYSSKFSGYEKEIIGTISNYHIDGDYLSIEIKSLENISGSYYFKSIDKKNSFLESVKLGDKVKINGTLQRPFNNTNPNLFNYKKYLYYNKQFYTIDIIEIEKIEDNNNLLYKVKNFANKQIDKLNKSGSYVKAFILGDNKDISTKIRNCYQNIGVSHLFAISGMHVTLISSIIIKVLKRLNFKDMIVYFIVILFLYLYMFLTGYSASVLRASIFFILLCLNKIFKLNIKTINLLFFTISILLLNNPFLIYNIGFLFSSIISIYLIMFNSLISNRKNYFTSLLMTSFIALIVSLPICIYNFFSFNYLSVFYNLLFVPLITIVVFPLSLITFLIPYFDGILYIFIIILESMAKFFNNLNTNLFFVKPSLVICLIYYIVITIGLTGLKKNKKTYLLILIIMLLIHYNFNFFIRQDYLLMIDVGQGDCILIHSTNKTILVDTGGKMSFKKKEKWRERKNEKSITDNVLLPLLKSLGIKQIDYLVLSHGDYDHMGEAINLVNNFKVYTVMFNNDDYNELEQGLIKVLEKKNINYYRGLKEVNVDKYKLQFLSTKNYDNENDNSNVIYFNYNNYKFLFMGDAGVEKEKDILENYNIKDIDFLKVGHHGSNTSSSKEFINSINPKYSLISVGRNNRYGHPKEEVLDNLSNSKIYRTDIDGSIEIKLNKNEYKIRTYSP